MVEESFFTVNPFHLVCRQAAAVELSCESAQVHRLISRVIRWSLGGGVRGFNSGRSCVDVFAFASARKLDLL